MDLHELMGTAVADLPELPDQLDDVERVHRRRTAAKRATLVSVSTALVLGVGTLTIASPWAHPGSDHAAVGSEDSGGPGQVTRPQPTGSGPRTPTVSASQLSRFEESATSTLQSIWPYPDQKVTWNPDPNGGPYPDLDYQIDTPHGKITFWVYYSVGFGSHPPDAPTGNAVYAVVTIGENSSGNPSVMVESWQGPNEFLTFQIDGAVSEMTKTQWTAFGSSPKLLGLYQDAKQLGLEGS